MIKPVDSGGQRGVFRLESVDDLEARFDAALALSHRGEVIVEQFVDGVEMNAMAVVRDGDVMQLTLSDRLRPPGEGFAVGWIHAYPAALDDGADRGGRGARRADRARARAAQRHRVPAVDRRRPTARSR